MVNNSTDSGAIQWFTCALQIDWLKVRQTPTCGISPVTPVTSSIAWPRQTASLSQLGKKQEDYKYEILKR